MTSQLPTLTGRPEDIHFAEADRSNLLAILNERLTATAGNAPTEVLAELLAIYREVALRHTDAAWWINHNGRFLGPTLQREFTADDRARLAAIAQRRA